VQISPYRRTDGEENQPVTVDKICVRHWVNLKPFIYSLHPTYIKDVRDFGGFQKPKVR